MKKVTFLVCFFVAFLFTQAQTTRYVKTISSGTEDGSSWENASGNIQAMINASVSGDQVWIACGTYPLSETLYMKEGVNIYGGFFGNENSIGDRTKSDLDGNGTIEAWEFSYATVLDGQNERRVLNQPYDFSIITVFDGLNLIKGYSTGVNIRENGQLVNSTVSGNSTGAIYNYLGTISNCIVTGNTAVGILGGGGINNQGGAIIDCTVSENTAAANGGGIYNMIGTITNCTVIKNSSLSDGGGIYNYGGTITNCNINENKVSHYGGGICNNYGGGTITNCIVSGNTAASSGGGIYNLLEGKITNCIINKNTASSGGGIYNSYGTITYCTVSENVASSNSGTSGGGIDGDGYVSNCIISGNIASSFSNYYRAFGGGISCSDSRSLISDCIVENNKTLMNNVQDGGGGGVLCWGTTTRCIIKGNSSGIGGGLLGGDATNCLLLNNNASSFGGGGYASTNVNCTFVGNIATSGGGGIAGEETALSIATNCIFWQNIAPADMQIGSFATVSYSAIQDGYSGTGNINITNNNESEGKGPLFVNLEMDDYRLQSNSPCIDAGNNSAILTYNLTTDLAGNPRIYGNTVDMGAYEWQGTSEISNTPISNSSIIIYPNPTSTELYVKLVSQSQEQANYIIYNSMGQSVMQGKIYHSSINIQSLVKGIYYLKITGKENATVKFMKN